MPVCVFTEPAELARHFFGEWWQREGQENGADATRPGGQARLVQNNWRDKENAMNYESLIRDFAERTRKNLRAIEDLQAKGGEAYEVTQLVNSMLGLLVFPRERFLDQIPQTSLSDLEADGWPVPKVVGDFPQARDLRELIRYLRNAIAHFNIEFIGEKIQSVRVWNTKDKRTTWKAEIGLKELRAIAERFTDLLLANDRPTSC
jgi:hypothetical protein